MKKILALVVSCVLLVLVSAVTVFGGANTHGQGKCCGQEAAFDFDLIIAEVNRFIEVLMAEWDDDNFYHAVPAVAGVGGISISPRFLRTILNRDIFCWRCGSVMTGEKFCRHCRIVWLPGAE